jgi:DivIVA domain-containing protein
MERLTPVDVRNVTFRMSVRGKRGYDEKEVDAFLDAVERTLTDMSGEIASLRALLGEQAAPDDLGQHAVLAELDQIKVRLMRIEVALAARRGPAAFGDATQGSAL